MTRLFLFCLLFALPASLSQAQTRLSDIVRISVLDGGQAADGTHLAALHLVLKDGWKTYWRAPGDAGIPPSFTWTGSRNVDGVDIVWPAPVVFDQGGLQSIGYVGQLVLPLRIAPGKPGVPLRLKGEMDFGVCKDICVPARLPFSQLLDPGAPRNASIVAALAQRPFTGAEAGLRRATCAIRPTQDGMRIETRIDIPRQGGSEVVVLEPGNPNLWASEMQSQRQGGTLVSVGEVIHVDGRAFALNRSALRITVIGRGQAVEIDGCAPA